VRFLAAALSMRQALVRTLIDTTHRAGIKEVVLWGFVVDEGQVWGRPVGVAMASDGALLVSDDVSNSLWRLNYGK
jgi:glucose/arabinose dehydrogenase